MRGWEEKENVFGKMFKFISDDKFDQGNWA
jgi:hypothetical protein